MGDEETKGHDVAEIMEIHNEEKSVLTERYDEDVSR
jgi:hypothetical protein